MRFNQAKFNENRGRESLSIIDWIEISFTLDADLRDAAAAAV
jgi:hypothetical protein